MESNACEWGAATLLIFSENVGALVYYTHIFPLLISLFLGVQIMINNPNALVNRVLFFVTSMFGLWVYFDLILWASPTPEAVVFFWSIIVPVEMLIYLGSLYLVYLFSTGQQDAPLRLKLAASSFMVPIILFTHTSLNVIGLHPDCDEGAYEGPLIQYMYLMELVIIFMVGYYMYKGYRKLQTDRERKQLLFIGGATLAFLIFFTAGNLTLVFSLNPLYEQYKLFGMPIFAGLVTYSILKFKAFNMKVFIVEVLVATLWILLFSLLLFRSIDTARPIIFITVIAFGIFGTQLVRSIRREFEQRERIESLVQDLKQANNRLRVLDKMKSEFVSIASHQLRSPLTAIRGYASMLLEGSYGKFPKRAHEAVERIAESSRFMAMSVEDYLNVSRIESGNMRYDVSKFDVKKLASELVDEFRPTALKKGILMVFRSDCDTDCVVNADIGKVRQAVLNLIDNALKYTKEGSVTVVTHDQPKKHKVFITVKDTGVGMDKETLEDVFHKFVRAKNANSVNVTGTGLGLYVARKMIEEMGGRIWAESPGEGKGSTFHIELPLV